MGKIGRLWWEIHLEGLGPKSWGKRFQKCALKGISSLFLDRDSSGVDCS